MRVQRSPAGFRARAGAKVPRLWAVWCESHPAPRLTVAFLVAVLMLAAFTLTRPGQAGAPLAPGAAAPILSLPAHNGT